MINSFDNYLKLGKVKRKTPDHKEAKALFEQSFNEEDINKFDHFRQLRNDLVYKAAKVMEADAKSSIIFANNFIQKAQDIY